MGRKELATRFLIAERPLRPVGATILLGEWVWALGHKLWEHAVLSWIIEGFGDEFSQVSIVQFIVLHPWWSIVFSVTVYLMIAVTQMLRSNRSAVKSHAVVIRPPAAISLRYAEGLIVSDNEIDVDPGIYGIDAEHIENTPVTRNKILIQRDCSGKGSRQ